VRPVQCLAVYHYVQINTYTHTHTHADTASYARMRWLAFISLSHSSVLLVVHTSFFCFSNFETFKQKGDKRDQASALIPIANIVQHVKLDCGGLFTFDSVQQYEDPSAARVMSYGLYARVADHAPVFL